MALIEKKGSFYLGKRYDLETRQVLDEPVEYDARDLTTHAVCVGMTGSGKTGLCIGLLEEAALDQVPAIIIDPKGDLTNLLLTFPELRPEDFQPWVNPDDAGRKELSVEEYAAQTAQQWRESLAQWDQGPERIQALREAVDLVVYTPGSSSVRPISILDSFNNPGGDWAVDEEAQRDRIQGVVSALLGLVGTAADPLQSREHILLSTLIEHFWRAGEDVDLGKLISAVQSPPIKRLGVLDLESFFPQKDRASLAMRLNAIIAAPSFAAWLSGDPLDVGALLRSSDGRPRQTIFYIAHLSDAERMFFVTILLEQLITWMRAQPGTTSLRAILYMDEVFGFFPPVANPPSKKPMLTLLKQARAYGIGCVLTTQNPVDLDYKGLSNAGTWFIGRLQTERDKMRVLDGLEGAVAESGGHANRQELDGLISKLGNRVFLLHNVHEDSHKVMQTRWTMSYLRGPLTRNQLRTLVGQAPSPSVTDDVPAASSIGVQASLLPGNLSRLAPPLPTDLRQLFVSANKSERDALRELRDDQPGANPSATRLVYEAGLLGLASVRFLDVKAGIDETREIVQLVLPRDLEASLSWGDGVPLPITERDLSTSPEPDAVFYQEVPTGMDSAAEIRRLEKDWSKDLYRKETLKLWVNKELKLYSRVGEAVEDFRARASKAASSMADAEKEQVGAKLDTKRVNQERKVAAAERTLDRKRDEYEARKREETVSWIEVVAGWLGIFGRRKSLGSSATKRRLTSAAQAAAQEAEADLARLKADLDTLDANREAALARLDRQWEETAANIEEYAVRPRRTDIQIMSVSLAWLPSWELDYQDSRERERTFSSPAYRTEEMD